MWAKPLSFITASISAKSALTTPGIVIRSDIAWTPCLNTPSANLKESNNVVFLSAIARSFSFGIITSVSTCCFKFSNPISACLILLLPSNGKGLVTTPTVKIFIDFAISATTGAAPVPVPPPIPAVINTIFAPFIASAISSLLSSAAFLPISGFAPAPRPLVSFSPIWIFVLACESNNACLSVLTTINSTFLNPSIIILLTALPPPPPQPITFILVNSCISNSKSNKITPP